MKLSKSQSEVLALMRQGWELGTSSSRSGCRCWIQKEGLCKGGETKDVNLNTLYSLRKMNLIRYYKNQDDPFWLNRYKLI